MRVPDTIEPELCWRSWLARREMSLGSVSLHRFRWPKEKVMVAQCSTCPPGRDVPNEEHGCGIYGTKHPLQPWEYIEAFLPERWAVMGITAFWGTTFVGTLGVRSQFAYPKILIVLPPLKQPSIEYESPHTWDPKEKLQIALKLLHDAYNVPVLVGPTTSEGFLNLREARKLFSSAALGSPEEVYQQLKDMPTGSSLQNLGAVQ